MIRLAKPVLGSEELAEVGSVFDTGYLTQGPRTIDVEDLVARYGGTTHAASTTSATVVIPQGATPFLADIDLRTFNLSIGDLAARIPPRTRAVMPVHLFGLP